MEIVGARVNKRGEAEILVTHNQTRPSRSTEYNNMNFSQKDYDIPPVASIGLLKRNPYPPIRGIGNELYMVIVAPCFGRYGEQVFVEAVIDEANKTQQKNS